MNKDICDSSGRLLDIFDMSLHLMLNNVLYVIYKILLSLLKWSYKDKFIGMYNISFDVVNYI